MSDWLAQARAANAALGDVVPSARRDRLLTGIGGRLRRRKLMRRAVIGGAGVTLAAALGMLSVAPRTPKHEAASPRTHALPVATPQTAPMAAPSNGTSIDIATTRSAGAMPLMADGSRAIALDATTQLVIDRDDATETHVTLASGAARFEVEPRAGKPFVVRAGDVSVHVVGTRFVVTRLREAGVEVSIEHGEVEVVAHGDRVRMHEGEQRVFEPRPQTNEARDRGAPRERAAPGSMSDAVTELLAAADRARREGRPNAAVAALRTLVQHHASDPRAASAAFSLGRVLLEAQHKPKAAATAFALVAKLEPTSPLVEDALAREVESWARAGALEHARSLARTYLQRYPNGARAALVRSHAKLE